MKQGALIFDEQTDRYDIRFEEATVLNPSLNISGKP